MTSVVNGNKWYYCSITRKFVGKGSNNRCIAQKEIMTWNKVCPLEATPMDKNQIYIFEIVNIPIDINTQHIEQTPQKYKGSKYFLSFWHDKNILWHKKAKNAVESIQTEAGDIVIKRCSS